MIAILHLAYVQTLLEVLNVHAEKASEAMARIVWILMSALNKSMTALIMQNAQMWMDPSDAHAILDFRVMATYAQVCLTSYK